MSNNITNENFNEKEFVESVLKNWVVLSIGTKGSGKTFLLLKYLKFAMQYNLYEQYVLVLPMFKMEQSGSYNFIDDKQKHIFVFDTYNQVITANLMKQQEKDVKKKMKVLYVIDDASGEDVWNIDDSLRHLITSIRHYNVALWMCVHSASGILSPFIRQQTDILLLSKVTNAKLLKNIYEEFLSLMSEYVGLEGHKNFIDKVIQLHKKPYQVVYMNIRTGTIDYNVANWDFNKLVKNKQNLTN